VFPNRGLAYAGKENYDKAIADCGEAVRLNPNYALAYRSRGNVYYNQWSLFQNYAPETCVRQRADPDHGRFRPGLSGLVVRALLPLRGCLAAP
jgi:tetratricopeptide (TPR) repeat protein